MSESKPRILMITSSFPLHTKDGNSPFVAGIAKAWLELGCHVDVVTPSHPSQNYDWSLPSLHIHAVDYMPSRSSQRLAMSGGGVATNLFSFKSWSQAPRLFYCMLKKAKTLASGASLIHACWLGPSLIAQLAASKASIPWGVSMLGTDVDRLLVAPLNSLWRTHLRCASFANANSYYLIHQAEKALQIPISYLPLEIDMKRFKPRDRIQAREKLEDFSGKGIVALALGRWIAIKGMDFLIALWPDVVARIPDIHLILAGYGPEEEHYKQLIKTLRMEAHITLKTYPREKIPLLMGAVDMVLMPSRREGLGIVAIEAMASGRVVLASDVGGLKEVLGQTFHAQLLPPSEPDAWIKAMVKLAGEDVFRDRLGQNMRQHVEQVFGSGITSQALQDFLPDKQ